MRHVTAITLAIVIATTAVAAPRPFPRPAPPPLRAADFIGSWRMDWHGSNLVSGTMVFRTDGYVILIDGRGTFGGPWSYVDGVLTWEEHPFVNGRWSRDGYSYSKQVAASRRTGTICSAHGFSLHRK
jgi:hypothetical protein